MGKRGPKKTPTAILEMQGSWRAASRKKKGEPQPDICVPHCPKWVDGKSAFDEVARELAAIGVMTRVDGLALGMLIDATTQYLEYKAMVEADGALLTSKAGTKYQHPACGMMNRAWEKVIRMCREFGLTPSARGNMSVTVPQKDEPDSLEVFNAMHA